MKFLKHYEDLNSGFNVGVYVRCHELTYSKDLKNFFENNIGKIESIDYDKHDNFKYYNVKFENIPIEILDYIKKYYTSNFDYTMPFSDADLILATPDEIKEQKIKNLSDKFNI